MWTRDIGHLLQGVLVGVGHRMRESKNGTTRVPNPNFGNLRRFFELFYYVSYYERVP
jgi:hypothetical protein